MKKGYVFFAEGFEEIEALTVVDLLRRANQLVSMVSVTGSDMVTGSHGISVKMDLSLTDVTWNADFYVLPGGMPGTIHLGECKELCDRIVQAAADGKLVAAICAAPSVLGKLGLLEGKEAVCAPGFEDQLTGASVLMEPVKQSGNIITSRGMGTAIPFALNIISYLADEKLSDQLAHKIQYR